MFSFVLGRSGVSSDYAYAHCCIFYHEVTKQDDALGHHDICTQLPPALGEARIFQPVCLWAITNAPLHMIMRRTFCRILGLRLPHKGRPLSSTELRVQLPVPPVPPRRGDVTSSAEVVLVTEQDNPSTASANAPYFATGSGWSIAELMKDPTRNIKSVASAMSKEVDLMLEKFQAHYASRCLRLERSFADYDHLAAVASARSNSRSL